VDLDSTPHFDRINKKKTSMRMVGSRLVTEPRTPENIVLTFVGVNEETHETISQDSQFPPGTGLDYQSELFMLPQS
jgi:hypothetical protein